jgi:protein involved in polysaccharide export with SLBB domain
MSLQFHQLKFSPQAVAKKLAAPLLLASLALLFGNSCASSVDPLFSEEPLPPSAAQGVSDGKATNSGTQPNAAGSLTQDGTNHSAGRTAPNRMDILDDKYRLAIGDRLSFRIEEDEEDTRPLIVKDSGDVEIPYIGHYPAVGKTCKELAQGVKVELEKSYYNRATVIISVDLMTKSRGKVYLVGPVRMPGPQDIPSDEILTLSKAILRAGGFTDYADKRHVKITRQGAAGGTDKETLVVDVGAIFDKGKTENDVVLRPGDLIYIPERLIRF